MDEVQEERRAARVNSHTTAEQNRGIQATEQAAKDTQEAVREATRHSEAYFAGLRGAGSSDDLLLQGQAMAARSKQLKLSEKAASAAEAKASKEAEQLAAKRLKEEEKAAAVETKKAEKASAAAEREANRAKRACDKAATKPGAKKQRGLREFFPGDSCSAGAAASSNEQASSLDGDRTGDMIDGVEEPEASLPVSNKGEAKTGEMIDEIEEPLAGIVSSLPVSNQAAIVSVIEETPIAEEQKKDSEIAEQDKKDSEIADEDKKDTKMDAGAVDEAEMEDNAPLSTDEKKDVSCTTAASTSTSPEEQAQDLNKEKEKESYEKPEWLKATKKDAFALEMDALIAGWKPVEPKNKKQSKTRFIKHIGAISSGAIEGRDMRRREEER